MSFAVSLISGWAQILSDLYWILPIKLYIYFIVFLWIDLTVFSQRFLTIWSHIYRESCLRWENPHTYIMQTLDFILLIKVIYSSVSHLWLELSLWLESRTRIRNLGPRTGDLGTLTRNLNLKTYDLGSKVERNVIERPDHKANIQSK